jgi:hypothetical protein
MTRPNHGRKVVRLEDIDPDGRFEAADIDAVAAMSGCHIVRALPEPQRPLLAGQPTAEAAKEEQRP